MRRLVAVATIAVSVLLTSMTAWTAEDEARPSNYEYLKGLEPLVGNWVGTETVPEEDERSGGQKLIVHSRFKWILDKSVLENNWSATIGGEAVAHGKELWYYDRSTKQVTTFDVSSDGGHGQITWRQQEKQWIGRTQGLNRNGEKFSSVTIYTTVDEDIMTLESKERIIDGKPAPDITIKCERMKPKKE